jgi:hypothetical protein
MATHPRFRTLRGAVRDLDLACRLAIAGIGAISIAFGILLIFEFAFGRGNLLAG